MMPHLRLLSSPNSVTVTLRSSPRLSQRASIGGGTTAEAREQQVTVMDLSFSLEWMYADQSIDRWDWHQYLSFSHSSVQCSACLLSPPTHAGKSNDHYHYHYSRLHTSSFAFFISLKNHTRQFIKSERRLHVTVGSEDNRLFILDHRCQTYMEHTLLLPHTKRF